MTEVPAALLPGGVLGVCVRGQFGSTQPFTGIIDCGSSVTILSKGAATLAGVDTKGFVKGRTLAGVGIDGRPFEMPIATAALQLAGDFDSKRACFPVVSLPRTRPQIIYYTTCITDGVTDLQVAKLPVGVVAVGNIPVLTDLLGPSGDTAAVLGIDMWSQGRLMFLGGAQGKRHTIFWKGP
jgi:hypothetical protein